MNDRKKFKSESREGRGHKEIDSALSENRHKNDPNKFIVNRLESSRMTDEEFRPYDALLTPKEEVKTKAVSFSALSNLIG